MFSDILIVILSVAGIISVFYSLVFRITALLTEKLNIIIPLRSADDNIHNRLYRLRSLCDFCHFKKRCTIVLMNCGASEDYCNNLRELYSEYKELRIISPEEINDILKE